jgi:hypothetical protein
VRDYLYISDAKVDTYIGQIRKSERKKVAANFGVNVGVLRASAKGEWVSQDDRVTRLEIVERRLLEEKPVGPLDAGKSWINGVADVVSAAFPGEAANLLFFFAPEKDHFLGLAGSAHHVIGDVRPTAASHSLSHLHSLLSMLEIVADRQTLVLEKSDEYIFDYLHSGITRIPSDVSAWTQIMAAISTKFEGRPRQRVSFLARRLTSDEYGVDSRRYTLATPLYIAHREGD